MGNERDARASEGTLDSLNKAIKDSNDYWNKQSRK